MIDCKLQFKRGHRGHIVEFSKVLLNGSDPQLSLHFPAHGHPEPFKDPLLWIYLDTNDGFRSLELIILLIPYLSLIIFLDLLWHLSILRVLPEHLQLLRQQSVPGRQPYLAIGDLGRGVSH